MAYQLHIGDCLAALRDMPDDSVDAVVTDPPYGLRFMGKAWDYSVPPVEVWAECLRVLRPGGHLLAFGGSRTYHRLAVNVEDAGFDIRDQIMWLYASGFPKGIDIAKAIDKDAGVWRVRATHVKSASRAMTGPIYGRTDKGEPICEAARQWEGWSTTLKPAHEPIVMARKPFSGTVHANVQRHGTGAINVDACRIGDRSDKPQREGKKKGKVNTYGSFSEGLKVYDKGRWPANLVLTDVDAEWARYFFNAPLDAVQTYGWTSNANTAESRSGLPRSRAASALEAVVNSASLGVTRLRDFQAPSTGVTRQESLLLARLAIEIIQSTESNTWPVPPPEGLFLSPSLVNCVDQLRQTGTTTITVSPAKSTGIAESATFSFTLENQAPGVKDSASFDKYIFCAKAGPRERGDNSHPTVKPVALMRHLCLLVTPPGGTILDPYMGSGSTGVAAVRDGFGFVGCELEPEYFAIAEARLRDACL